MNINEKKFFQDLIVNKISFIFTFFFCVRLTNAQKLINKFVNNTHFYD